MSRIEEIFKRDLFFLDKENDTVTEVFLNEDGDSGRGTLVYMYFTFDHLRKCFERANGDSNLFFGYMTEEYEMEDMDLQDDPKKIGEAAKELCIPTPFEGLTKETMFGLMKEIGLTFRNDAHWENVKDEATGEEICRCSRCGYTERVFNKSLCSAWGYCPKCGARIEE